MQLGGSPETVQKQLYRYLLAKREVPMGMREMLPGSLEAGGSQHPLPICLSPLSDGLRDCQG